MARMSSKKLGSLNTKHSDGWYYLGDVWHQKTDEQQQQEQGQAKVEGRTFNWSRCDIDAHRPLSGRLGSYFTGAG